MPVKAKRKLNFPADSQVDMDGEVTEYESEGVKLQCSHSEDDFSNGDESDDLSMNNNAQPSDLSSTASEVEMEEADAATKGQGKREKKQIRGVFFNRI